MLLFYVLWKVNCILDTVKKEKKKSLWYRTEFFILLFSIHSAQSMLDQAELQMRQKNK